MKLRIVESDGIEIRRIKFPSDEANEYLEHEEESEYLDELNKHSIGELIVDKNTGDLIGKVFVYKTKYPGFIYNLQVEPKYRGKGFGKVLTDDAVKKFFGVQNNENNWLDNKNKNDKFFQLNDKILVIATQY